MHIMTIAQKVTWTTDACHLTILFYLRCSLDVISANEVSFPQINRKASGKTDKLFPMESCKILSMKGCPENSGNINKSFNVIPAV